MATKKDLDLFRKIRNENRSLQKKVKELEGEGASTNPMARKYEVTVEHTGSWVSTYVVSASTESEAEANWEEGRLRENYAHIVNTSEVSLLDVVEYNPQDYIS